MDSPTVPARFTQRARWWWRGRDWRTFRLGAPALAAGLGCGALAVAGWTSSDRELQSRYLAQGKAAFQAGDYPRALTCYERVAPTSGDPDATYRLALTAEAMGDGARAVALMRGLAPEKSTGYAPAHYWLARHLLAAPPSPQFTDKAESHLVEALKGDLDDKDAAHGLLGHLYLSTNRLPDAEFHLSKAAATHPIFRLSLARTYALRGNPARARQEAEVAIRFFRDRAKSDAANLAARLAWADATTYLDDYSAAVAILDEGLANTRDETYRLALAKLYLAWHDVRKKESTATPAELLTLLDKGLTHDPANKDLLNRLLDQLHTRGADANQARGTLRGLLAKGGTAVASIHFALAIDARLRGDAVAETVHLEQAFRLDPKTGIIANNLAWVLSQPPAPDLSRARALADMAVTREPGNPTFRDTRGHIHLAAGRWQDALVDLEIVLAAAPGTPGLHTALGEVYEHLGQRDLAAEHRRLAILPTPKRPAK